MELALIYNFQSLSSFVSFQLLFLSRASFFLNSWFTIYRQEISLASSIVSDVHGCSFARPFSFRHTFSLINRWKNGSTRSWFTDMMFYCLWHLRDIVPPLITILLSNLANPRRDLLLEQASLYQTCSTVFTVFVFQSVFSSMSPTEWMAVIQGTYLSSYFHTSRWRASSN